jgi:hypothetical protein
MIQPHEIEARLSGVWEALARESREFRLVLDVQPSPVSDGERRIVLPVGLDDPSHRAGVALVISHEDAKTLASVMFDLAPAALEQSDIDDACAEACNVFSGCLVEYLPSGYLADIGLPEAMALEGYRKVSLASGVKALFEASQHDRRLAVILFDPMSGFRPGEVA